MTEKIDIPIVSGKTETLLNDIQEAWTKHSKWIIPVAFFSVGIIVLWEVIRRRLKK